MSWRLDEVWLDTDVLWFRAQPRRPNAGLALTLPAVAGDTLEPALFMPIATGLEASLQRAALSAQIATDQIDHDLALDLLDRFVTAAAQIVFVGYSTGLRGPSGVVVPYPHHENHMHVRFPPAPS